MKVFVLFMIICSSKARQLITLDETETLFKKYMLNQLTETETASLKEIFELLYRHESISSRSLENSSAARLSLDCIVCRNIIGALFQTIREGQTEEEATNVITTLCTSLNIENYNVCRGAVALNMPIFVHIIRTVPEATPQSFCSLVLQSATNSNICTTTDPRFEWEVQLPDPPEFVNTPEIDPKPLRVAIITDVHLDPLYEPFGVGNCDEPTCCRYGQTPAQNYLYSSNVDESLYNRSIIYLDDDIMLDLSVASEIKRQRMSSRTRYANSRDTAPAGYWGDYRDCDTPLWAFDDTIETIAETHKGIDMVYYIGDTIDHGVWETSYELINNMNLYLIDKIRKTFGDDVLVVPVIGNHEAQPTNQFAPSSVTGEKLNTTWLYEALAKKWDHYLTDEAKATLLDRGDFSILARPGLRIISLNNNVAYRYNWWIVYDPLDAKKHLDWLVEELQKAEQAGEKVHILTHIPPGVHDLTYTWTREYNRIINRFSATIAAEFNGHVHSDEFKVFYSLTDGTPINVAWGGGGATTYSHYNLNYKIVDFDSKTFLPQNIVNYIYNITEANLTPHLRPHWFQLYDMRNTFGLADLSAASINDLVYRMPIETHLLDLYSAFFSKLSDNRWPYCNIDCKLNNMCKIVVTVLWEHERCDELRNLYFLAN
ncbi:sphingomyelin phosphodiesterase 1-like [Galleria mellonella]|uniref:Sphingomyelin phosphodiesterase n=1 Tax=Galleria mellonella TaxID=7137 RepID=A0A6J1WLL2_GALME|nr:sphingomyelin phosphodiesterase 1-like [Galleria mellonella]